MGLVGALSARIPYRGSDLSRPQLIHPSVVKKIVTFVSYYLSLKNTENHQENGELVEYKYVSMHLR